MVQRNTVAEMIAVLQAYAQRQAIQCNAIGSSRPWTTIEGEPEWNFPEFAYRIRPEPKEIWVNEYAHQSSLPYRSKSEAVNCCGPYGKTVRYREVVE